MLDVTIQRYVVMFMDELIAFGGHVEN